MKEQNVWKNYKIYTFVAGLITGTAVYNLAGIDFSFSMIKKITIHNFLDSYFYLLGYQLRFWIGIFLLSFLNMKNKISALLIFIQAFLLSGVMTLSILTRSSILLYDIPIIVFKIFAINLMFRQTRPVFSKIASGVILAVGTLVENIFLIYF